MKKQSKIFMKIAAVLSIIVIFAAGCKPDGSDMVQGGDDNSVDSSVNSVDNNSGDSGEDSSDDDDGYTRIAQGEAVEFIANYAEQFLKSDNVVLIFENSSAFNGKFKSINDSNGNPKKIAKMNGWSKSMYEYLDGEETYFTMLIYNDFDTFDELGVTITSENDSGGVLLTDDIIYGLKYIDGDFYPVSKDSNSSESSYTQSYVSNFKAQAAIYLCECAMFISDSADGSAEKVGNLFADMGILSVDIIKELSAMVIDKSVLQMVYNSWGGEDWEVETKIEIGYIKTVGSKLGIELKLLPKDGDPADPVMNGECIMDFSFDYAAGLDENHFNETVNKTAPQS